MPKSYICANKNNPYFCVEINNRQTIILQNYMNTTLLLMGIGTQEFLFIILIILILFGGKKIPELMKGLGKGVKSFKEGMNEVEENLKETDSKKEEVSSTDHKEK